MSRQKGHSDLNLMFLQGVRNGVWMKIITNGEDIVKQTAFLKYSLN